MADNHPTSGVTDTVESYLKDKTISDLKDAIHTAYNSNTCAFLDTLKVANLTQEGPTKTVTGGQYANALIKFGKTARCEMQEALGSSSALCVLGGAEKDSDGNIYLTNRFPGPVAICGRNYFIDQKSGKQNWVDIVIPQFLPDAVLSFTQDAEGDATVFDLNGDILTSNMKLNSSDNSETGIQYGIIAEDNSAKAFDRFGVVTVMTDVIAVPWTVLLASESQQ